MPQIISKQKAFSSQIISSGDLAVGAAVKSCVNEIWVVCSAKLKKYVTYTKNKQVMLKLCKDTNEPFSTRLSPSNENKLFKKTVNKINFTSF